MRFPKIRLFFIIILAFITACSGLPVDKVALQNPVLPPEHAKPSPIGFNKIVFALPTGTPVASSSPKGIFGLLECEWPYGLIAQGSVRGRGFPTDGMREIFQQVLEGQGYEVTGSPGRLFDEEADLQRTIYSVGGRIIDIKMDTCQHVNFWGVDQGRTGEGHVAIEWSVFDLLNRKTVMKKTTKGYGKTELPNFEGITLLFDDAVAAAMHNLGADEEFYNLVFYGETPSFEPESHDDPYEKPAGLFDPQETVVLNTPLNTTVPAKERLDDIIKSVVMIQKAAHGSGFFITGQGHIITNAHVVGTADRMRIVTSGKEHNLVAEVLRLDKVRDIALLKLESIPQDFVIKPLPVRTGKTKIGENVYAIGTPNYTRLQDTVTKGIISAHRLERRGNLPLIQADADVHGGNSGGPLLDEFGNVIGISVSSYVDGNGRLSGLNDFIPIGDGLERLNISIEANKEFTPIGLVP